MKYNSKLAPLAIPEYGRNVQNMVNHCMSIEDREERNRCAKTIIAIMGSMFPEHNNNPEGRHLLWDHLAMMSDFKLDVDYPEGLIQKEQLERKPERIEYSTNDIVYRHYGHLQQELIQLASEMEDGEEREALIMLLANHMKRSYQQWNKDSVADYKIFKDLFDLSDGKIELCEKDYALSSATNTDNRNNQRRTRNFKKK